MAWSAVIGQERAKGVLRAAWRAGKVPGAYLFSGIEGVGKDALALEFAALLNCEQPGDDGACGVCGACARVAGMRHPNVTFICALPLGKNEDARRDGPIEKLDAETLQAVKEELQKKAADPYYSLSIPKAQNIKLSSVRGIKKELSLSAFAGRRVVVVSRAEQMNAQSQNALLKTLEEPPPNAVFVLTTAARRQLRPTLLSRCQMLRCDALSEREIAGALERRAGVERETAARAARLAGGSYALALRLCGAEYAAARAAAIDFLRALALDDYAKVYNRIEELARSRDRGKVEEFLSVLLVWFRDAEAVRSGAQDLLLAGGGDDSLARFVARYPGVSCGGAARRIEGAAQNIRRNVSVSLALRALAAGLQQAFTGAGARAGER